MIELSPKQKKHLRSLGQRIKPVATVGKAGISEAIQRTISALLDQHELVKINIPAGDASARQAAAQELATATNSALVSLVGRMVVLYRANPSLPGNRRIGIPA